MIRVTVGRISVASSPKARRVSSRARSRNSVSAALSNTKSLFNLLRADSMSRCHVMGTH